MTGARRPSAPCYPGEPAAEILSSVLCDSLSRSVTNWAAMTELAGGPEAVPYDLVSRPF